MASTMTDVLVLLIVVFGILLLSTGFDRFLTMVFTRPSTQKGRDLLTAVEDMVLPMGSFPSRLLYPWSSALNPYKRSPLPPTEHSETKQEAVLTLDEPTHIQTRTKEIPILSFTPLTTIEIESSVDTTSHAVNNVLAEFHVLHNEIRELIDPKGIHSPQAKITRDLVAGMINNHAEAINDIKHDREEDQKKFERNLEDHETKYRELNLLCEDLSSRNVRKKEKSRQLKSRNKCLKIQIEKNIQDTKDAVTNADEAEQVANARAQKRIEEVKLDFEQSKKASEDRLRQERDSMILLKRQIESELAKARSEVKALKEQQKTAAENNTATLNEYKECLRKRSLDVTSSKELTELAERKLEALRNEKLTKYSQEVADLENQLRASKDLAKSLGPWKTKAENHERMYQRLREKMENAADDMRENKDHHINSLELDISGLQRDIATDEVTINRQNCEIAELKSGKGLLKLKSELEQAKKLLKNAELETKNLRRDLTTSDATKQDAENALMEIISQHEKDQSIAVHNAIQQAETAAAEKAAEKAREYAQRIRTAVEDAKKNAAEKDQEYAVAMRAAVEEATGRAVVDTESKAAAVNAAAELVEQAARETEMDTAPDPELYALRMKEVEDALRKEHQNEIAEKVKNEVEKALENAKQQHQQEKSDAVQDAVGKVIENAEQEHRKKVAEEVWKAEQNAKVNFEKEKNELIAAKDAAEAAQQAQEAAEKITSNNPIDLTLAATEADEASNLLEEVVKSGMAMGTAKHTVLRRLMDIRGALHNLKVMLQKPDAPTETSHYKDLLRVLKLEEYQLKRLENEPHNKPLVRQARLANERLKQVSEILQSSDVQKDALLQALIGPKRQVVPMRGLKRPTQSNKPVVDNSQPFADYPPAPSATPKADNRPSFAEQMKKLNYY